VDTGMKDLVLMRWNPTGPQLAVATAKGNLLLYNKRTLKKVPILGKHTKKIVCGAWSRDGRLALGSEDRQITLTTAEGDNIANISVKAEPVDLHFNEAKTDGGRSAGSTDNTLSVNLGRNSLLLQNVAGTGPEVGAATPDKRTELAFQAKYGSISTFKWFGDGYILLGFSSGSFVVISTHAKEIGNEIYSASLFKETGLVDLAVSSVLFRAAVCGDSSVRILDVKNAWREIPEDSVTLPEEHGQLERVEWTRDGQILTVASKSGTVYNYLARIPNLTARHGSRIAYLSSLREIAVAELTSGKAGAPTSVIRVGMEPAFVAVGPSHVVVGGNNHSWAYKISSDSSSSSSSSSSQSNSTPVSEREYVGTVDRISLNSTHVAALSKGVVQVHAIEDGSPGRTFPDSGESDVSCMALTDDFLIYGTRRGVLKFYALRETGAGGGSVAEYRCPGGCVAVYPNATGTRVVVLDDTGSAFVYGPATDEMTFVPEFPSGVDAVIWDPTDWPTFVAVNSQTLTTYVYVPITMRGAAVEKVGVTDLPRGAMVAAVHSGSVVCQTSGGALESVGLSTHSGISTTVAVQADRRKAFHQMCALHRLKAAWELAHTLGQRDVLTTLGDLSLRLLDVDTALRVYRKLGDVSMVLELQRLLKVEDRKLLAGNVALMLGDHALAQDLFLASSSPVEALEMRCDLLEWEPALLLAKTLAPEQIPRISREYGKNLEFTGEYKRALALFEAALTHDPAQREHDEVCYAGIARCSIRLGDLRRGIEIAGKSGSRALCKDCAQLLEALKQGPDAAALYEKAGLWDRAGSIYIQAGKFAQVKPLMDAGRITTPKLYIQYARAKESAGDYPEAVGAYERAGDLASVVRLSLEHLGNAESAFAFVRKSRNAEGASMVAKFCVSQGNYRAAIEFFLIAKRTEEAFELAKRFDLVAAFAEFLKESGGSKEQFRRIAEWFENQNRPGDAGVFYARCGEPHRALRLFLQCGEKHLNEAVEVVGKARDDQLTHTLIDFLIGETDNVPKDASYVYKTYLAVGNFVQAARTAVVIATQEQALGNYKAGRDILFEAQRELSNRGLPVPSDLGGALVLLHSYIMVKSLIVLGDHVTAARLLLRVAKNISKFPTHIVPILTTTVIETRRANLKRSAFEYAAVLMRPEYRSQIKPEFLKNLDHIARKPVRTEDEEETSPCPYCAFPVINTNLDCTNCKRTLPWCIVTGQHMVASSWSSCPSCKSTALHGAFNTYLANIEASSGRCPMCQADVQLPVDLVPEQDVKELLKSKPADSE
jgi:WD repeat-containing protein 19